MTRATVGGINAEDNLWYPLAVNSQGIAQIDTSGIPQPMAWEYGTFNPVFASTDSEGTAIIEYARNNGWYAKLGDMVWVKVFMRTLNCTITNPRGNLIVTGFPFTWLYDEALATLGGASIGLCIRWRNNIIINQCYLVASNLYLYPQKLSDAGGQAPVSFADLNEANGTPANDLVVSFWGRISSTDDPPPRTFRNGVLIDPFETPTDTP